MHKPIKFLIAVLLCSLVLPALAELKPGAELPMPDRKMTNVDDTQIAINDIKGEKGTVVVFWCNHCPVVKAYRQRFINIVEDYAGKGLGFIAVNPNDPEKQPLDSLDAMKQDAEKFGYEFAYVVDEGSQMARAFGASKTPHVFVFNPDDKLVYVGAIDDDTRGKNIEKTWLRDALDALAAGKDVPAARSKAFGCSIKWYAKN